MIFQGKSVRCSECGNLFTFTAGEQGFYAFKSRLSAPKTCPSCRLARERRSTGNDPLHLTRSSAK